MASDEEGDKAVEGVDSGARSNTLEKSEGVPKPESPLLSDIPEGQNQDNPAAAVPPPPPPPKEPSPRSLALQELEDEYNKLIKDQTDPAYLKQLQEWERETKKKIQGGDGSEALKGIMDTSYEELDKLKDYQAKAIGASTTKTDPNNTASAAETTTATAEPTLKETSEAVPPAAKTPSVQETERIEQAARKMGNYNPDIKGKFDSQNNKEPDEDKYNITKNILTKYSKNKKFATLLESAEKGSWVQFQKACGESGINPNDYKKDSSAAFISAIQKGDIKTVEHLIEDGVDVNLQRPNGGTPLDLAAGVGNKKICELLEKEEKRNSSKEKKEVKQNPAPQGNTYNYNRTYNDHRTYNTPPGEQGRQGDPGQNGMGGQVVVKQSNSEEMMNLIMEMLLLALLTIYFGPIVAVAGYCCMEVARGKSGASNSRESLGGVYSGRGNERSLDGQGQELARPQEGKDVSQGQGQKASQDKEKDKDSQWWKNTKSTAMTVGAGLWGAGLALSFFVGPAGPPAYLAATALIAGTAYGAYKAVGAAQSLYQAVRGMFRSNKGGPEAQDYITKNSGSQQPAGTQSQRQGAEQTPEDKQQQGMASRVSERAWALADSMKSTFMAGAKSLREKLPNLSTFVGKGKGTAHGGQGI